MLLKNLFHSVLWTGFLKVTRTVSRIFVHSCKEFSMQRGQFEKSQQISRDAWNLRELIKAKFRSISVKTKMRLFILSLATSIPAEIRTVRNVFFILHYQKRPLQ